jgi:sialic acid synthase SpsE
MIINPKQGRKAAYIAEIGINHNGDMAIAQKMIEFAAKSGADAVKFQTIIPELLYSIYTNSLLKDGSENFIDYSQIEFFKKFSFSQEDYTKLKQTADAFDVIFLSSSFDVNSMDMLNDLGVIAHKLASSEVANLPLIRHAAKSGKPLILSTGMSSELDIEKAISEYYNAGGKEIELLHCVSLYPPELSDLNLMRIVKLREKFSLDVGFSDHSKDNNAAFAAAILGAKLFEKHFTFDKKYECPDKVISLDGEEFSSMINAVETGIDMLGDGKICFSDKEAAVAASARRSLFAAREIEAGKILEQEDLIALRPGIGISPNETDIVLGKKTNCTIPKNYLIREEYFN